MTSPTDLAHPPLGTRIQDPLLVLRVSARQTDTGSYSILTLGNRGGSIDTAPFWPRDQHLIAGIGAGQVVQVIGEVTRYRDRRQLAVTSIRVLPPGAVDWHLLMPSAGNPGPYWETIDRWIQEIRPERVGGAVSAVFDDADFRRRFEECPAATVGPEACIGGLLKHTVEVAAIGRNLARITGAELGLVLAGGLIHDIGKTDALTWTKGFHWRPAGRSLGAALLGTRILRLVLEAGHPPPSREAEIQMLEHLILVTGEPPAVVPVSRSARILQIAHGAAIRAAEAAATLEDPEANPFQAHRHESGDPAAAT